MASVVVGSINQDLVVRVPRHPRPGETVLGRDHFTAPGGKGANQAVALARLGRQVAMVGRVGDDNFGSALIGGMAGDGVDTAHIGVDPEAGTGLAVITLDDDAENAIVVSPGANGRVTPADVEAAAGVIGRADAVLLQLEIPLNSVVRAAELATGVVVLNPAPARELPAQLLSNVGVLVPNRSELALLAQTSVPETIEAVVGAARSLDMTVVVTLGSDGAVAVRGDEFHHVPAPRVEAVDTVGAGDAFCAGLTDAITRGSELREAVEWAVLVGALAVTKQGAQPSMPTREEVLFFASLR